MGSSTSTLRRFHFNLLAAGVLLFISFGCTENTPSRVPAVSDATLPNGDTATHSFDSRYSKLRARIVSHNDGFPVSAWMMNSEHLFIEDDSLRPAVIQFSREKGGLDYLFDKVLNTTTSDEDLLIVSEILVWFGGHLESGDERIVSTKTAAVLGVLKHGRASKADQVFKAPVTEKIRDAAEKAENAKTVPSQ